MTVTRIEFRTHSISAAARARVAADMKAALAFLPVAPTSARVTFTDENGPKGGEAIQCALEVRLPRRPAVHVADVARTPRLAFDAALAKPPGVELAVPVDPDDPHSTARQRERRRLARAGQAQDEGVLRKQTRTRSGSRGQTRTRTGSRSRSRSGP